MIGELAFIHLDSHVVQKCLAGQQKPYRDTGTRQTKEMLFLCLIPVRFMLLTKTFLYHVTDQLQGFISPNVDWVSGWRGGGGGGGGGKKK